MTKCKGCGKKIGDLALICPNCGESPGQREFFALLGFIFKLMAAIFLLGLIALGLDSIFGENETRDWIVITLIVAAYLFSKVRRWRARRAKRHAPVPATATNQ